MTRVVHVSWSDAVGGAAKAAWRIHDAVRRAGVDSRMLVEVGESGDPAVAVAPPTPGLAAAVRRRVRPRRRAAALDAHAAHIAAHYQLFSIDRADDPHRALAGLLAMRPFDLVHLHWVSRFVDYAGFFPHLPPGLPVVWTLHDMNPFTGGCHYSGTCPRFAEQCGCCPALRSDVFNDPSNQAFRRKADALDDTRVAVVSPSRWLAGESARSRLFNRYEHHVIANPVDTGVFRPIDPAAARAALGVPADAKVVLFIAESAGVKRKGIGHVIDVADRLRGAVPGLTFLSLGKATPPLPAGVPHVPLGFVAADRLLPIAYSAADLTLVPSLQDNLPNTVVESLACGTPVVGFDVGGIPDMVRDGVTGHVVPAGDAAAMAAAARRVLTAASPGDLRRTCRAVADAEYSAAVQGRRYAELYARLTG